MTVFLQNEGNYLQEKQKLKASLWKAQHQIGGIIPSLTSLHLFYSGTSIKGQSTNQGPLMVLTKATATLKGGKTLPNLPSRL